MRRSIRGATDIPADSREAREVKRGVEHGVPSFSSGLGTFLGHAARIPPAVCSLLQTRLELTAQSSTTLLGPERQFRRSFPGCVSGALEARTWQTLADGFSSTETERILADAERLGEAVRDAFLNVVVVDGWFREFDNTRAQLNGPLRKPCFPGEDVPSAGKLSYYLPRHVLSLSSVIVDRGGVIMAIYLHRAVSPASLVHALRS